MGRWWSKDSLYIQGTWVLESLFPVTLWSLRWYRWRTSPWTFASCRSHCLFLSRSTFHVAPHLSPLASLLGHWPIWGQGSKDLKRKKDMGKHLACRWHNQDLNPGLQIQVLCHSPPSCLHHCSDSIRSGLNSQIFSKTRYIARDQQQVKARISGHVWEVMVLSWCLGSLWATWSTLLEHRFAC